MSESPRPAYPVLEDIRGRSEFSHQGISFVVPHFFDRVYVQQIWKIREQVFLRWKDKTPETKRTTIRRILNEFVPRVSYAQCGVEGGTDVKENG